MTCQVEDYVLEQYFDDELSNADRALVEHELEHCPACQARLEAMSLARLSLQGAFAAVVDNAPLDGLWDRVQSEIQPYVPSDATWWERVRAFWSVPRLDFALGAAAAACAAAIVTWVVASAPVAEKPGAAVVSSVTEDHTLVVESIEALEGTVVIDVDPENPSAPAVVWHYVDEEGA